MRLSPLACFCEERYWSSSASCFLSSSKLRYCTRRTIVLRSCAVQHALEMGRMAACTLRCKEVVVQGSPVNAATGRTWCTGWRLGAGLCPGARLVRRHGAVHGRRFCGAAGSCQLLALGACLRYTPFAAFAPVANGPARGAPCVGSCLAMAPAGIVLQSMRVELHKRACSLRTRCRQADTLGAHRISPRCIHRFPELVREFHHRGGALFAQIVRFGAVCAEREPLSDRACLPRARRLQSRRYARTLANGTAESWGLRHFAAARPLQKPGNPSGPAEAKKRLSIARAQR